jgi:hypothetical protein
MKSRSGLIANLPRGLRWAIAAAFYALLVCVGLFVALVIYFMINPPPIAGY